MSVGPGARTMKGLYVTKFCAHGTVPESIAFGDVPAPPAPTKAEVLIGVRAASINVDDIAICQDTAAGGWFFHARTPTVDAPLVGGMDYAGVVVACGPECKKLKVGDRVVGLQKPLEYQAGTWAEQTLVSRSSSRAFRYSTDRTLTFSSLVLTLSFTSRNCAPRLKTAEQRAADSQLSFFFI